MAQKQVRVKSPKLVLQLNKHNVREIYVLDKNEFVQVHTANDVLIKRVGPAIVEVHQQGNKRQIVSHPINGKEFWELLSGYVQAGVWALNARTVAGLLPDNLVELSRFRGKDKQQRKRLSR